MIVLTSRCMPQAQTISAGMLLALTLIIGGCAVGPRYSRPSAEVPQAYKEIPAGWKAAQPSDQLSRGKWWEIFGDPQHNTLQEQVTVSNQDLKAAQARFMQARALVRFSRAGYFPTVTASPSASRTRVSRNVPGVVSGSTVNDFVIPIDVSYEADVWGRVRRTVESARAEAQATAADLESTSLSLHAELAVDYFQIRSLDAEEDLLQSTVSAFEEALQLTLNRFHGGIASQVDVEQARTQLETTRAQMIDVQVERAQFEHAVAALIGKPASSFSLPRLPLDAPPPAIPPGIASALLERRPDIAAAERRMAEANANIGVAKAAYYPQILLAGSGGLESRAIQTLVNGPSAFWSIGGAAVQTLFDGGRRRAVSEQARAAYDENVANYRQSVLTAFQEVEDNLAAQRILETEAKTQDAAVASAQQSLALSLNRYKGGVTTYLEVITAQSAALANERAAVQILGRRMSAAVLLIKALGGGWDASQLTAQGQQPTPATTASNSR